MVVRCILLFSIATHFVCRTTTGLREVQGVSHFAPIALVVSRIKVDHHSIINDIPLHRSSILAQIPRGGGSDDIILDDNDIDDGVLLQKIKHIVRSLLQSTKDIPVIQGTLSSFIQWIEASIGIKLMPQTSSVGNVEQKKKMKQKGTKQTKTKLEMKSQTADSDAKRSISSKTTKETNLSKKKSKVKKSKTVSAETSMQIKKDLKATNPNYRIQQELKSFLLDPPKHLSVRTGKNIRIWIVTIEGIGIYEGETFRLRIQFPNQYPTVPPSVYFLPPNIPVHEHVYTNGDICLSLLGKDWRPTMTAQSVAHSILSILTSATSKTLPMDNSRHAGNQPGQYQENWVYHDDNC